MAKKQPKTGSQGTHTNFAQFKEGSDRLAIASTIATVLLSILVVVSFFSGEASRVTELLSIFRTFVFPWLFVLLLLSIARELWAIRVYAKHIHLGGLIERYIDGEKHNI